jgi:hypothetical protein
MGSTRMWLLLAVAQIVTLIILAAAGPVTAATPALRYIGFACLAGIFACIPPIVVKLFVAAQIRVGNGAHPVVRGLREHEAVVIVTVWVMIVAALMMAMPRILSDLRAERDAASMLAGSTPDSQPIQPTATSSASAPVEDIPVSTPGPGSPERAAILDAVRRRVKPSGKFRVDHIRMAGGWAFVRATEVFPLDGGELQETDLTVAALLELPAGSTTGWWRIADYWTLPGDQDRPLAEFAKRVRDRLRAERLPAALLPGDL